MDDALKQGTRIEVGANRTFYLDDPEMVWIVEHGQVELFAVDQEQRGRRWHVASLCPGQALFGLHRDDLAPGLSLLASGTPDTRVLQVSRTALLEQAGESHPSTVAALLDGWIAVLINGMVTDAVPTRCQVLDDQELHHVSGGAAVRAASGLRWVEHRAGHSFWLGERDLPAIKQDSSYFPLTPRTWLETGEESQLHSLPTPEWLTQKKGIAKLGSFYRQLFAYYASKHRKSIEETSERVRVWEANEQRYMDDALQGLASVMETGKSVIPELAGTSWDPLFAACQAVAKMKGIEVAQPPSFAEQVGTGDPLEDIASFSGLRVRQVALKGEWWRNDNGPLLAYEEETDHPLALLPIGGGAYDLYNPQTQIATRVNAEVADQIKPFAYTFYRPLPARKLGIVDLVTFSGKSGITRDVVSVILMGVIGGLLGLVIPIATGTLVDTIIPEAENTQLIQMVLILLVSMLAAILFEITGGIAMLRLETRVDHDLQSAVWDRLLNLPVTFFKQYSVGDLAMRANCINAIRQTISGVLITTVLAGVFSSFQFVLLFYYDVRLSLLAVVLVAISVLITTGAALLILRWQRELIDKQGHLSSLVLQLLHGIAKIRVAGAESRAFYLWSQRFGDVRRLAFRTLLLENYAGVFTIAFPMLCSLVLFASVGAGVARGASMSTGQFLAFYAAFSTFIAALTGTFDALISGLSIVPLYERAKPILHTQPEAAASGDHPGQLLGDIEVSRVSFRYDEDGPRVLQDVSLSIGKGEFVAIVGASGSGKSTLMRMMLGFESPQAGAIYYDGQDLDQLNVQAVRRQLGVVLQNSQVMDGDIFTNIIGARRLTLDDAAEAANMVGLADDIAEMPMGMHTVVSEGGSTLSGGQRQRLLIARAVVAKPRIIFFDEATSALDNRTQAMVSRSLEQLRATRVVIAHRLSTIMNADRIYVMDRGQIVQQGTYQELINQQGLFHDLAKRQLA